MKRFLSLLLCWTLLLSCAGVLSSCKADFTNGDKPLVVTTIFSPYDFAKAVGGDRIEAHVLVKVTDSHSFSPTAADMALIEECDLFIYTGGDGDRWAEDFLSTIDTSDKVILNMMELCPLCEGEPHEHEHGNEEHHHEESTVYDEHVWMDPANAMRITEAIRDGLGKIDPAGQDQYTQSAQAYLTELSLLDSDFRQMVDSAKRNTIVVADRFPYLYLCHAYGIEAHAALAGCGSASDLTAVAYEALAHHVAEDELPVILCTEYSDRSIAGTVLRESKTEAKIMAFHSCHTLTGYEINQGTTYLSLMRENLQVLTIALN